MIEFMTYHKPVLPNEVINFLNAKKEGIFLDLTLGGGGHSRLILEANPKNRVIAIDRDCEAIDYANDYLKSFRSRFSSYNMNFSQIDFLNSSLNASVDGILMDLGVSSHQIDEKERGFSFEIDCPLDMRMDRRQTFSATQILNEWKEKDLAYILLIYGEDRLAKKIAKKIVDFRKDKFLNRSRDLVNIVESVVGRHKLKFKKSLARVFQAIRIEVNQELKELKKSLLKSYTLLKNGGKLVIISFHSLEDRIVKKFFAEKVKDCLCPVQIPVCICNKEKEGFLLNKKVVTACPKEIQNNRRASSAKLRAIRKLGGKK